MDGPPIGAGAVLVDGERIVAVGPERELLQAADRIVHVPGVILPGLVNAHAHLEHAAAAALATEPALHRRQEAVGRLTRGWSQDQWQRSARHSVLAALRAGATAVGDVVGEGAGVPAAHRAGLVGTSWVEVAWVDVEHHDRVLAGVERALGLPAGGRSVGIAADAVCTLGTGVLQGLVALAGRHRVPLHVHAAQSRSEVLAISRGAGPFADLARARGYEFEWLDGGAELTPVRYLDACGALSPRTAVSHGVWVDDDEVDILAARGATVVLCPRADAGLGTAEAPLERYAEAGVPLALGTEGLAAVADLDPLGEAAAWRALAERRGMAAWPGSQERSLEEQAIRLITVDGAAAMGWGEQAGVLAAGRRADLVGVALATTPDRVYADLLGAGQGRQVLTVAAGVRRSRRDDPDEPWPPIDDSWREEAS